ncbi:hypothetical protein HY448_01675 [Candidatus Pacearchaeota archaeon]|nr:hypothetical protein [Candidatus Pacearchaeota archaeon]
MEECQICKNRNRSLRGFYRRWKVYFKDFPAFDKSFEKILEECGISLESLREDNGT